MLVLVSQRLTAAGVTAMALSLAADLAAHIAGWSEAEPAAHLALFLAMVATFFGVVLRGTRASDIGKERVHASR